MKHEELKWVSFHCYYKTGDEWRKTRHTQEIPISAIPKWIEAYRYTHPNCYAITAKVWLSEPE